MLSLIHMTVAQLSRPIDTLAGPIIIDVHIESDVDDDPRLLPTAICYSFDDIVSLAPKLWAVVSCATISPQLFYNAFYRWVWDATGEGHDWPTTSIKRR